MNLRVFFIPLLAAALLWIPSQSFSAEDQGQHRMWSDLGLTADQQSKLKAMHNEMQEIRMTQREEMRALRAKIKEELTKSNPSKSVLSGFASDLGKLQEKQAQSHIDHMIKLKTILTQEQFQKVIDKEWNGRGQGMQNRGSWGGHGPRGGCDRTDSTAYHKASPQM